MRPAHWILYGILMLVLVVTVDTAFRGVLSGRTEIETRLAASSLSNRPLIIYLPGLLADGEWSPRLFVETWRQHGDVWLVNPLGDRFDGHVVAQTVAQQLESDSHEHVIFIGSSLGGHLADQVIGLLNPTKRASVKIDVVAACSPGDGSDIQSPLRQAMSLTRIIRFGPLANATIGHMVTRVVAGQQPRQFELTYYIDQVRYVAESPRLSHLAGVRVFYLQADEDELVSKTAAVKWQQAADSGTFHLTAVHSKHVAYDTTPTVWDEAFEAALQAAAEK